jgi:hypothetical protein
MGYSWQGGLGTFLAVSVVMIVVAAYFAWWHSKKPKRTCILKRRHGRRMRGNGALLEEDGTEIMDVQYDVMNVADRIHVGGGQTIEGSNQFLGTVKRAD